MEIPYLDEERLMALEVLLGKRFGDLVSKVILHMEKKDRVLGKWSPRWEGPFKVLQVFFNGAYEI